MSTPTAAEARVVDTGQHSWTPKHETFTKPIRALWDVHNPLEGSALEQYNGATRALLKLVRDAQTQGVRLRALGGGWSFTEAPLTDGWMVNTKWLNLYFNNVSTLVHPNYGGDRAGLRFAQCGCSIQQLNTSLRAEGRSLRTVGASNGQTIAGALSTGTHGSALDVGTIPDYVVGLHLVVGPNRHVWLERASRPVMNDDFAARLNAEPVRDDELFAAALVSFGSFGLIHGVMIETDPVFLLRMFRRHMPLDAGLRHALDSLDFSRVQLPRGAERPYHFQVVVNPYSLANGVHVTTMYRGPFRAGYPPPPDVFGGFGPGDDAISFVGLITDKVPAVIPAVASNVLAQAYKDVEDVQGTIGEIFSNTTTRGKANSTAIGLPLARATEVMDLALELNRTRGPFASLVAFRFVKATGATLGWQRFAPATCILELDAPLSGRTRTLYELMWKALDDRQIPHTFHWGKQHALDAAGVRRAYGAAANRWVAARERLLDAPARATFTNAYLQQLGLAT
ncbi:MAG TPA: FAD-binding protein [Longimicrobium sp.]|jgi:FAD/FMN-containing dehydrogenase|nr:FAD-binding protein [Longimicrobium sp.]